MRRRLREISLAKLSRPGSGRAVDHVLHLALPASKGQSLSAKPHYVKWLLLSPTVIVNPDMLGESDFLNDCF